MQDILLHTPEGVRDIYGAECAAKLRLQAGLAKTLNTYGYHAIQTPAFEFFDIFNGERGTLSSREMYKFFDREGNTLVLRPDMTPSIARAAAKYYADETLPLRFSYVGNVFINNSSYQGLMKETTQIGAELIGATGAAADAELIALAIELLLKSGLSRFVLDIGHAGFFKALIEAAALDVSHQTLLKELIENKNYFGIESLMEDCHIPKELGDILLALPRLSGQADILKNVRKMTTNESAQQVLDYLEEIYGVLCAYGYEKYITFDLAMLTTYDYYTGVIFRGYTYGTGAALVKGGRYDHLVGQFGKDAAAVGFALVIDQLMLALSRQKIDIAVNDPAVMILYDRNCLNAAIKESLKLRASFVNVTLMEKTEPGMSVYTDYCKKHNIGKVVFIGEPGIKEWEV